MATKDSLQTQLKEAMKNRDNTRRDALRMVLTAVKNAEIDKRSELTEDEVDRLIQKEAKQRRESITEYRNAGRADLVAQEEAQLAVVESLMPQQMSEDELRELARAHIAQIGATSPKDIGKVMGPLRNQVGPRADGSVLQRVVRELLSGESNDAAVTGGRQQRE
jgi:uncharacterized protein YqeY